MTVSWSAQHDRATVSWFAQRERVDPRGPSRERRARSFPRVRIVETKPCGCDVWLRISTGESIVVGGLLLTDVGSLSGAIADSLDAELVLPLTVTNGERLVLYLLDPRTYKRRLRALQRASGEGPSKSETGIRGTVIGSLFRMCGSCFSLFRTARTSL